MSEVKRLRETLRQIYLLADSGNKGDELEQKLYAIAKRCKRELAQSGIVNLDTKAPNYSKILTQTH